MADQPESKIDEPSEPIVALDAPSEVPFRTDRGADGAVICSLDGRPQLRRTTRRLVPAGTGTTALSGPANAAGPPPADQASQPMPPASPGPTPSLVVRSPSGSIETRRTIDSPRFLVGRDNCDLELDDRFVARWHVQLFQRDGALVLQDMNSRNGVFLRIADDLELEDGDQIIIGQQRFKFRRSWDSEPSRRRGDPDVLGASWNGEPDRLIRYLEGNQIGGVYPLRARLTIGASRSDLCFPDDGLLSSPHAMIQRDKRRLLLRDTDSDSGTFIQVDDAVELVDGDCFLVGRTRIRLTFSQTAH